MSNLFIRNARPLSALGDLDRMMDAVFGDLGNPHAGSRIPAVDVVEEDTRYLVNADIPGFSENEVEIKVDDQLLTISGKHAEAEETADAAKKSHWLIRERRNTSFVRSFTLPTDVEKDQIKAHVANGQLSIELPKAPKAQPRTIDIQRA